MRILIVGVTGMLGSTLFRYFQRIPEITTFGTVRGSKVPPSFSGAADSIIDGVDAENFDSITLAVQRARPDVVINAVGLIKQLASSKDPLKAVPINALFPHRLARLCAVGGARLIHLSTDCVFSGKEGGYTEGDVADADDLYGRSKFLGEVDYENSITLRTSIIGHELGSTNGLIGWFLSQEGEVRGFTRAVFSGFPTVEIARIIESKVLPDPTLHGLYHVASAPISKHDLLKLVAHTYQRPVVVVRDDSLVIDRSLDASRFNLATGYKPPSWPDLVGAMKNFG